MSERKWRNEQQILCQASYDRIERASPSRRAFPVLIHDLHSGLI